MKVFLSTVFAAIAVWNLALAQEEGHASLRSEVEVDDSDTRDEDRELTPLYHLKLYVKHDLYPQETSWFLKNSKGKVYGHEVQGSVTTKSASIVKIYKLPPDRYTFTIYDVEEDGICCGETGDGYIRMELNGNVFYDEKGDFLYKRRVIFNVPLAIP